MQTQKSSWFSKYKLDIKDVKANLLSRSLLWMGLGLSVIVLFAWICSNVDWILRYTIYFTVGTRWIVAVILNVAIVIALFYSIENKRIPIIIPITLYIMFALYEGFFITTILALTNSNHIVSDLLVFMLIPSSIFGLMGVISFFNLIDFTKLLPFTIFATIGLFILGLVLMFSYSSFLESIYLFTSCAIFTIWVGVDIQLILRKQQELPEYNDKKEINRLAFFFGVSLFMDFVRLLIIIIRIFRR